jgi:hypothetical protein
MAYNLKKICIYSERELFLKQANEDYARLKKEDPEGWKELLEERKEWEVTLADGLDDEKTF